MRQLETVFEDEKTLEGKTIADNTRSLLHNQIESWEMARNGYSSLSQVQIKEFEFDDYTVKVQFNPGRIVSTSAKVDKKSIEARKCFLCYQNLPADQKGIPYFRDYLILVNPFPIFPEHLTIPKIDHVPQYIEGNMQGMLNLTKDIGEYFTVFYNGPKCGASAPDHMHFQAGKRNFMPLDTEIDELLETHGTRLFSSQSVSIQSVSNYLGKFFLLEGNDKKDLNKHFLKFYEVLKSLDSNSHDEPKMNILCSYSRKSWRIIVFPRMKHRPDYYFMEGDSQILISPASVDFGGVLITPREEDFNKMNKDIIQKIFRQVSISPEIFEYYRKKLKEVLNAESD